MKDMSKLDHIYNTNYKVKLHLLPFFVILKNDEEGT